MASKRQLDDKRKEDRALALLSLAADRPEPPGLCPTESELARLVEGRVPGEERKRLQHHLSICGDCYRQWLTLSRTEGRPAARGRLVRPGRFRRAGYIGTTLALAASIAIFLNIYHEAGLKPTVEPAGQVQLRETGDAAPKTEEVAPPAAEPQPSVTDAAGPPAPARPLTTEKSPKERTAVKPAAPEKRVLPAAPPPPAAQGLTGGSDGMVRQQDKMADQEMTAPAAPAESAAPKTRAAFALKVDDAGRWLDRVREGCRAGRLDPDFWLALQAEGEGLCRKLQSRGSADIRTEIVSAILPLLAPLTDTRPDPARLAGQCRLLQDELAKEGQSGGTSTLQDTESNPR